MENRNGLIVDACLTPAGGHAERVAALHMIEPRADRPQAITLGADKAYDAEDFVNELRSMKVTPHVAQNLSGRSSAIDGRTTRHSGYTVSQRIRKRIEEAFGWVKTVAGQEKTKYRGRERVGWAFTFAVAAYNLIRLPKRRFCQKFETNQGVSPMRGCVSLAALATISALTIVGSISPVPAGAVQDRYCLQGRIWGYPGNCQFSSYPQCMATASGTDAYCGINPQYLFARQRRRAYRDRY